MVRPSKDTRASSPFRARWLEAIVCLLFAPIWPPVAVQDCNHPHPLPLSRDGRGERNAFPLASLPEGEGDRYFALRLRAGSVALVARL